MDDFVPNDPWKAREYEIDVNRWKEIEREAGKAMDDKEYHYAKLWYEKIFKEVKGRLGKDDPNLLWLKRHYSEALMKVGFFEEADKLQEELLKIVPHVALDADGVLAIDPDNLIQDVLYLRSLRAQQLLNEISVPEADRAVSILEAAQVKSRKVLGKKHNTTLVIGASLEDSEKFRLELRQKQRRKELDAEDELLDDTRVPEFNNDSDSLSEKEVIENAYPSQSVESSIPMRQAQQRPQTSENVESEESILSDAQLLGATDDEYKITDKWFSTYLNKTHSLLNTMTVGKPRVRIAILDTGLNREHEKVKDLLADPPSEEKRIKKWKSWVPGIIGIENTDKNGILLADEDTDGHGTHCAMVAHKVAPDADIYVARIFRDRKSVRGDHLVKAINWAIKNDVDIISMSFALNEDDTKLIQKIWNAVDTVRYKVLMFAAASNDGLNAGRKFPARHPDVFCIHSASGAGTQSEKLNPGPWRDDFNYTALGEHVEAPSSGNSTPRVSGTSVAAPVAAGIAALVLGFTRQGLTLHQRAIRNVEKLKTKAGMDKIFSKMVDPNPSTKSTDDYVNIQPWQWLVHNAFEDPEAEIARESISNDINQLIYRVHHPGPERAKVDPKKG